ncbi:MAG: NERD domain-containing protein, partial [Ruminococcus sp.]|nr:NERD domain-containing protein [Ruminococcus sp.]
MGLFDKLREPVILKEDSSAKVQLEQLNSIMQTVPTEIKSQIEQDIRLLQYGIYGEDALMFELKNSHMPMYIMHDLFFEMNGLKSQIDFLVITR